MKLCQPQNIKCHLERSGNNHGGGKDQKGKFQGSQGSLGPAEFIFLGHECEVLSEKLDSQLSWPLTPQSFLI